MKTKKEILSEVSKEGIGTLGVMLCDEPKEFRFAITEVYEAMDLYAAQKNIPHELLVIQKNADGLLPCPYCGSKPIKSKDFMEEEWNIYCSNTECGIILFDDEEDVAIAKWNKRT